MFKVFKIDYDGKKIEKESFLYKIEADEFARQSNISARITYVVDDLVNNETKNIVSDYIKYNSFTNEEFRKELHFEKAFEAFAVGKDAVRPLFEKLVNADNYMNYGHDFDHLVKIGNLYHYVVEEVTHNVTISDEDLKVIADYVHKLDLSHPKITEGHQGHALIKKLIAQAGEE